MFRVTQSQNVPQKLTNFLSREFLNRGFQAPQPAYIQNTLSNERSEDNEASTSAIMRRRRARRLAMQSGSTPRSTWF